MNTMIEVENTSAGGKTEFQVTVSEGAGKTTHRVSMSPLTYKKLSKGAVSEERLVQAAFEFLLDREPKESILRSFDLTVISRYFQEFEGSIGSYLDR